MEKRSHRSMVSESLRSLIPPVAEWVELKYREIDEGLIGRGITNPASLTYQSAFSAELHLFVTHNDLGLECHPASYHDEHRLIVINTAWNDRYIASAFFRQATQVLVYCFLQAEKNPGSRIQVLMRRRHHYNEKRIARHLRRYAGVVAQSVNLSRYGHLPSAYCESSAS